mgnify:CR=1 FL=1
MLALQDRVHLNGESQLYRLAGRARGSDDDEAAARKSAEMIQHLEQQSDPTRIRDAEYLYTLAGWYGLLLKCKMDNSFELDVDVSHGRLILAYSFVRDEVRRGRQAFVVCPLIDESAAVQSRAATIEYELIVAPRNPPGATRSSPTVSTSPCTSGAMTP